MNNTPSKIMRIIGMVVLFFISPPIFIVWMIIYYTRQNSSNNTQLRGSATNRDDQLRHNKLKRIYKEDLEYHSAISDSKYDATASHDGIYLNGKRLR